MLTAVQTKHMTTAAFQVGNTYSMRWIGDADRLTPCKVVKRTAKFVTFEVDGWGVQRVGVRVYEGSEVANPLGRYSMAPCVRANREVA